MYLNVSESQKNVPLCTRIPENVAFCRRMYQCAGMYLFVECEKESLEMNIKLIQKYFTSCERI